MSSNKKVTLFFIISLLIMPLVLAQEFNIYKDASITELCPGSTGLFTHALRNEGTETLSFTVSTTGTSSTFSTTVPQGLTLLPGQSKTLYTYVSPRSTTSVGAYELNINAESNGVSKSMSNAFNIVDCYDYSLETTGTSKNVCPAESARYDFKIENRGRFTESYLLSVEGQKASFVELNTPQLTLAPGESQIFYAYVESSPEDKGDYDFTVKVYSVNSKKTKTVTNTLTVDPCYDFEVSTEKDLINICEHTQEVIPISIDNAGSTQNEFTLEVQGPAWANMEKNSVVISPNSQQEVNLVLNPDYGIQGAFEVKVSAKPTKGELKVENIFNVNVKQCNGVVVDIESPSDRLCNSLENAYTVNVRNTGENSKEYYYTLDGPAWARLDKDSSNLGVGQDDQLTLTVNPPFDTPKAAYIVTVTATARDSDKLKSSDKIEISTISQDECYQALLGIENKRIEVYYDSSATVPIVVENKGASRATYDLSLSGTGSNFAYLNPSSLELDAGKSEIVYLYVAPSGQIEDGTYSISLSVRSGDSSILASDKVDIVVSKSAYLAPEDVEEIQESDSPGLFTRIGRFFSNLFSTPETNQTVENETIVDVETPEDNQTETEEPEEVNETEEVPVNVTEEQPETTLEELDEGQGFFSDGDRRSFLIDEEEHSIEVISVNEDESIDIIISSDPINTNLKKGDVGKYDLDGDGVYDLQVVYLGIKEGKADLEYTKINEEIGSSTEEPILDEITGEVVEETDNTDKGFFGSFFASLGSIFSGILASRTQIIIIAAVIILVYLVFRTGFYKKLVSFFEEEIEEENVPLMTEKPEDKMVMSEVKTEKKEDKPMKKEVKKETKKEVPKKTVAKKKDTKKKVTEDTEDEIEIEGLDEEEDNKKKKGKDDDFIIEFDDD